MITLALNRADAPGNEEVEGRVAYRKSRVNLKINNRLALLESFLGNYYSPASNHSDLNTVSAVDGFDSINSSDAYEVSNISHLLFLSYKLTHSSQVEEGRALRRTLSSLP